MAEGMVCAVCCGGGGCLVGDVAGVFALFWCRIVVSAPAPSSVECVSSSRSGCNRDDRRAVMWHFHDYGSFFFFFCFWYLFR
jgi:hypothetical protein